MKIVLIKKVLSSGNEHTPFQSEILQVLTEEQFAELNTKIIPLTGCLNSGRYAYGKVYAELVDLDQPLGGPVVWEVGGNSVLAIQVTTLVTQLADLSEFVFVGSDVFELCQDPFELTRHFFPSSRTSRDHWEITKADEYWLFVGVVWVDSIAAARKRIKEIFEECQRQGFIDLERVDNSHLKEPKG